MAIDNHHAQAARALGADRGWGWIAEGFDYFKRAPGAWIAMVIILGVLYIVATYIRFIGFIAASVAMPIFMGGLMLACRRQDRGEAAEITDLFAGFKNRTAQLVIVGVVYLVGTFIISLIGGGLAALLAGGDMMVSGGHGGMGLTRGIVVMMLVVAALSIPLLMAIWFAPALVLFNELEPLEAMRRSFAGCLKNIVPFLIYGVVAFVICFIAAIPFGLGFLVAGPVLIASVYVGYREIFA
ncbi:MAG TPA: BPSS1780 family membrane protein [Gammaproteobacteria bacterium]|nr:BPSS1780 family membrane protein [Gammaproteobacteria bacterium]